MQLVFELFRIFPIVLIIICIIDSVLYKSPYSFWLLVGLILNGLLWLVLTKIFAINWPMLAERPNRYNCSYLEQNKPMLYGGFPSGHCQSMGFFVGWVILIIWSINKNHMNIYFIIYFTLIIIVLSYLSYIMMYSRTIYYKCHTWSQAIFGTLIGLITSLIMWNILHFYKFI